MSYLNLPGGISDFSQAVISLWFRVPQVSMDKAKEQYTADAAGPGPLPRLSGVIPLVTFGPLHDTTTIEIVSLPETASYTVTDWEYEGPDIGGRGWVRQTEDPQPSFYSPGETYQDGLPYQADPSYIGVAYDGDTEIFYLRVNLQTGDVGSPKWLAWTTTTFIGDKNNGVVVGSPTFINPMSAWIEGFPPTPSGYCLTDSTAPGNPCLVTVSHQDISSEQYGRNTGPDVFTAGSTKLEITPDQWHHVLVSFDVSNSCTATGAVLEVSTDCPDGTTTTQTATPDFSDPNMMWLALDDVNYTEKDLFGKVSDPLLDINWEDVKGLGPNEILSRYTRAAYGTQTFKEFSNGWVNTGCVQLYNDQDLGTASYTFPASPLPASGQAFGIPAAANVMDKILHVEMAEFQMFTGITADTDDIDVRRAFIDKDGKPVPPNKKKSQSSPTSGSIEFLGQEPDILLHGSSKWVKGVNTGTIGVDAKGKPIPKGQFTPTGEIKPYKPNPSLHGPQTPPPTQAPPPTR